MSPAVVPRGTPASSLEGLIESTEALKACRRSNFDDPLIRGYQHPLCVRDPVLNQELTYRCSERPTKDCHRVVGMKPNRPSDFVCSERLGIVLSDVARNLVRPRERRPPRCLAAVLAPEGRTSRRQRGRQAQDAGLNLGLSDTLTQRLARLKVL